MMFLGTVYSYSVFRIPLEEEFQIGSTESGLPYMTSLAFYAIFMFLTGKYIEKYDPRMIILTGGLLVAVGWIMSSFATNIIMLTITYGCIGGAGVGIAYGAPMNVVAKWFPEKKGFAVGMVLIGFGLSPLITAPLARVLVESFGVMQTFLILGVCLSVLLPIVAFPLSYPRQIDIKQVEYDRGKVDETLNVQVYEMIRMRTFKGIYLNFVIGTMIGLMLIGSTVNIGVDYVGMDSKIVTQFMALFAIFNGLGRPIFGWVTDKLKPQKAMFLSYALILASSVLMLLWGKGNEIIFVISFSMFWFNLGGWLAIAPASTLKLFGIKYYTQNYGLIFTAYGFGAITGVSTTGGLLDATGNYDSIFYYVLILCILGIFLTTKFMRDNISKGV